MFSTVLFMGPPGAPVPMVQDPWGPWDPYLIHFYNFKYIFNICLNMFVSMELPIQLPIEKHKNTGGTLA